MKHSNESPASLKTALWVSLATLLNVAAVPVALADGTETLGDPSIPIASGTGILAAGTGMVSQPGSISVDVPAGATVNQVLLYWEGQMQTNVPGDDTINAGGTEVLGTLIGGQTFFFNNAYSSAFRADITDLSLVSAGPNTFSVSGLDFTKASNGAGVLVIYDDGSTSTEIGVRDGVDLAFINFPDPRKDTIAQTFNFAPAAADRTGSLTSFFASVAGTISGADADRPSSIEIESGGTTTIMSNLLASTGGEEWDTLNLPVTIPAGASSLTVQAFSRDDLATGNLPASFSWIAAGLAVTPPELLDGEGCTPGYWKQPHHLDSWVGYSPDDDYETVFGVDASFDKTLRGALKQGGGGEKALGRHAVAALLNASSLDVSYAFTEAEVIAVVQDAYASGDFEGVKNQLAAENKQGCPIN